MVTFFAYLLSAVLLVAHSASFGFLSIVAIEQLYLKRVLPRPEQNPYFPADTHMQALIRHSINLLLLLVGVSIVAFFAWLHITMLVDIVLPFSAKIIALTK